MECSASKVFADAGGLQEHFRVVGTGNHLEARDAAPTDDWRGRASSEDGLEWQRTQRLVFCIRRSVFR